ncbi:hypothetical protein OK606_10535, partial [Streptococcus pneumoniae]|nr:hypothetical protein [Streptococcus pneumoniae]
QGIRERGSAVQRVESIAAEEGLEVLGWVPVEVDPDRADVGLTALGCMPYMSYLFVAAPEVDGSRPAGLELDRLVYGLRKRSERVTPEIEAEG